MGYVLRGCVLDQGFGGYVFRDSVLVRFREVRFERVCFEARVRWKRFSGSLFRVRFCGVRFERVCFGSRFRRVCFSG